MYPYLNVINYLLDVPSPGLVRDDPDRNAVLSVGRDGKVSKLTLLHPHVPVSVDLLTSEPFLPAVFWSDLS